jgi:hypothetical protein
MHFIVDNPIEYCQKVHHYALYEVGIVTVVYYS